MKKMFIFIFLAILSGALLGGFTFDKYEDLNVRNVIKLDNSVYLVKYKTFNDMDDMLNNITNIDRYIYIIDGDKITTYIGVSKTLENINKVLDIYKKQGLDVSIENINISNDEFIQNLDEYEKLLNACDDEKSILIIQNQILSCYERLVVNDE